MIVIRTSMSRAEVIDKIHLIGPVLAGRMVVPGSEGIARGFALRLAVTAMGFLKPAFVTRAQGGTDEAGLKWAPLAPSTIARRMLKGKNRRITRRERRTRKELHRARQRFEETKTFRQGLLAEARIERAIERHETAFDQYRNAVGSIEILRDTGRLFNSLSPGYTGQLNAEGLLSVEAGSVTFGTNVHYAKYHHSDEPRKLKANGQPKLPQRRLWPKPENWPATWIKDLNEAVRTGAAQAIHLMFGVAA